METVGIGVIGLGFMATKVHLPALRKVPEAKLIAVSSRSPEKAKKYGEKFGAEEYYTDYKKLLKNPDVDVVILPLPPRLVASIALEVAEAGKHAILECPVAESLEQTDRLIEAEKEYNVKLMPGQCLRFAPTFLKVKELLDKNEVGTPVIAYFKEFVPAATLAKQWEPGSWIWNKEKGGPVPTMTFFSLELLRWLLDSDPASIYGSIRFIDIEKFGILGYNVGIVTKFKNGTIAMNENSGSVTPVMEKVYLEIVGEKGNAVAAENGVKTILYGEEEEKEKWTFPPKGVEMWGHRQQDRHFIKSIQENKNPSITLQDARKAMEMTIALLESDKTGKPIYL